MHVILHHSTVQGVETASHDPNQQKNLTLFHDVTMFRAVLVVLSGVLARQTGTNFAPERGFCLSNMAASHRLVQHVSKRSVLFKKTLRR